MKKPRIHLEIQTHRSQPIGVLRASFRDAEGKVRHTQHGRITGVPLRVLQNVQAALRDEVTHKSDAGAFKVIKAKELGASQALLALAKELGLPKLLYSRNEPWVQDVLALVVGRILYQGSKLALSHEWDNTALWELCGVDGSVDVDEHCYKAMDRLLERQPAIQKALAARHLKNGSIVLYDITSSYLEGEYTASDLVEFGYNRDRKRGCEQIVVGLLTDERGCPVGVEVFQGNTKDESTVPAKIKEMAKHYGLKDVIFVGDRGMITQANEEKFAAMPEAEGLQIISALNHREIAELLERTNNEPGIFDEKNIVEIADEANPEHRYCLCRNPFTAERSRKTREELLKKTTDGLEQLADRKTKGDAAKLGAVVGKLLAKTRMGKFIQWKVKEGRLTWSVNQAKLDNEAALDGCYVVKATVKADVMSSEVLVERYKSLKHVEHAFRCLKTTRLEMRPVYHRRDDRIRAHVFLCMLAYYVVWHATERLEPLFAEQKRQIKAKEIERKDRQWTMDHVWATLKQLQRNTIQCAGTTFQQDMEPSEDQAMLQRLLATAPGAKTAAVQSEDRPQAA